jgi:hypothetical protein
MRPQRPNDAPGYKCKPNRDGTWREGWEARHDLARRGYKPVWVRLHYPDTPDGRRQLAARCADLQGQMLAWAANEGKLPERGYNGTIKSLGRLFLTDEEGSPYFGMKWNSQAHLDKSLKIVTATVGDRQVGKLLGPDFKRWHKNWGEPKEPGGKPRPWRARHCMDATRCIIAYGVTCGYDDCLRGDTILSKLRFTKPPARSSKLSLEYVNAIRSVARDMGLDSIALGTVLQFELTLRQKDVIGEWEPAPLAEGGILFKGRRWVNGLLWSDIDTDMVLRVKPTKTFKRHRIEIEFDLKLYPLIMEEIAIVPSERRVGPMIVSEHTGEPYKNRTYTQTWRRVADAAGVPRNIWNMDARAGGISESEDAGAIEADRMKHAGHKNPQTHRKYARGSLEETRRVAQARLAFRTRTKGRGRVRDA